MNRESGHQCDIINNLKHYPEVGWRRDNRELFLSLGAFYGQRSCTFLYNKKHKSLKEEINRVSAFVAKVGAECLLFGTLNIKGSVGLNLGLEESKGNIRRKMSNIHTRRNEFVFDLGLSMYF